MTTVHITTTIKTVATAALALLWLSGCSSDMDELKARVTEIKGRPGERIEPLPQIKAYESFIYNASNMRSPFVPSAPARSDVANAVRPDSKRTREFLEQFPLDTLRMVGTLARANASYGLVQSRDGLVHRVTVGNHMGQNYGRITAISDSEIQLVEIISDGLGGYLERPAAIGLTD